LLPFGLVRSVALARTAPRRVLRAWALLAVGAAVGFLVGLVQVLPAVRKVSDSWRPTGTLPIEIAGIAAHPPAAVMRTLGNPRPTEAGQEQSRQAYVGVVTVALAVVGLATWRVRSVAVPLGVAAAGAAVYAFGRYGPVFPLMYRLPMGSWFRGTDRSLFV